MDTKRVRKLVADLAAAVPADSPKARLADELRRSIDDSLDAAWAEAEAALPEGWAFEVKRDGDRCDATAADNWGEPQLLAVGPDPASALRGLIANLRELRR